MSKAYIQFITKNGSLKGEGIQISTDIIPRVGEIINASLYLKVQDNDDDYTFIVLSVIYELTLDGFVPYISAREYAKSQRFILLQERGWLIPEKDQAIEYDEDDPAINMLK